MFTDFDPCDYSYLREDEGCGNRQTSWERVERSWTWARVPGMPGVLQSAPGPVPPAIAWCSPRPTCVGERLTLYDDGPKSPWNANRAIARNASRFFAPKPKRFRWSLANVFYVAWITWAVGYIVWQVLS
jgi:hypothetical protein